MLRHVTEDAEAENVSPEARVRLISTCPDAKNGNGMSDIDWPFTMSSPSEIVPE